MTLEELIRECRAEFASCGPDTTIQMCEGLNLAIVVDRASNVVERQVYESFFCLVLQGRKKIALIIWERAKHRGFIRWSHKLRMSFSISPRTSARAFFQRR